MIVSIILSLMIYYGLNFNGTIVKLYGYSILLVGSGSMEPELKVNDVIIIKEQENYSKNDVITFNTNGNSLVTHRILEKEGMSYITKGDNNNSIDEEIVSQNQIEGKVIYNSKVLKFIYNNWLFIIIAIIILLIIF